MSEANKCSECGSSLKYFRSEKHQNTDMYCPVCEEQFVRARREQAVLENETQLKDPHVAETFGELQPKEALRFDNGKPELMYVCTFPNALREFSKVCTYGGRKYDVGNYLKGAPLSQYVNCGLRHLFA